MTEETVHERTTVAEGQLVMPFYLVCDVSYSMTHDMPALNAGIRQLCQAIGREPQVDDVAQVGIITFSAGAQVAMPLTQMSEEAHIPTLSAQSSTNYGAAFRILALTIDEDLKNLKAKGYKAYRPCAFFLTDGEPTDDTWFQTFTSTLTYDKAARQGNKAHPIFVPFGFRDARDDVLSKLAYPPERGKWFHAKTHDIKEALDGILNAIMTSVFNSGLSGSAGTPTLMIQTSSPVGNLVAQDSQYDSQWPS